MQVRSGPLGLAGRDGLDQDFRKLKGATRLQFQAQMLIAQPQFDDAERI